MTESQLMRGIEKNTEVANWQLIPIVIALISDYLLYDIIKTIIINK